MPPRLPAAGRYVGRYGGAVSTSRPAAGGGRWVEVDPARLPRWLDGFWRRHGEPREPAAAPGEPPAEQAGEKPAEQAAAAGPAAGPAVRPADGRLVVTGADGAVAELYPPPGAPAAADLAGFVAAAQAPRRLGLLLARKAAAAMGVADGGELTVSKVDSWYVQGRTAAGGQSQQRFARRRVNQASAAAGKAADLAVRLLLPPAAAGELAALVTGGDKPTVASILGDPRLTALAALRTERHLPVPTPNLATLRNAVPAARSVVIHIVEPGGAG